MVNNFAINEWAINEWVTPSAQSWSHFIYNWLSLCSANIKITSSNRRDRQYNLNTVDNSFIDGGVVLSNFVKQKSISFGFAIKADTTSELETLIATFKEKTAERDWLLQILVDWDTREIPCNIVNDTYDVMPYWAKYQTGNITFRAVNPPRFYLKTPTSKTYQGITGNFNWDLTNNGNAKSYPVYYFIFGTGISWLSQIDINLNWFTTTINETINDNDILVVNGDVLDENGGKVTLNWTEVDFAWPIDVELNPWSNIFSVDFNGGTVDCNISVLNRQYFE